MIITIALFIFILGVLVLVHEAGHFFTARRAGIRVEEFGFGFSGQEFGFRFPPKLFTFRRKGVLYSINPVPFGGFVKIFGESGEGRDDPLSFASRPVRVKLAVLLAGVFGNILLAYALLSVGQWIGAPNQIDDSNMIAENVRLYVSDVAKGSPAADADLGPADIIVELRNSKGEVEQPTTVKEIQEFIYRNAGERITIRVARNGAIHEKNLTPRKEPPEGEGPLGVGLMRVGIVRYPWYEAPYRGFFVTAGLTVTLFDGITQILRDLALGRGVAEGVAGPIGIASFTGQVRALGAPNLLSFIALLSLNLGLLNLLPIPALDGGRAAFVVVEKIIGKPVPLQWESRIHAVAFLLLFTFLIWISVRDVQRLF